MEEQSASKASHKSRHRKQNSAFRELITCSTSNARSKPDIAQLVDQVKHKIESCIQSYMTKEEVAKKLKEEGNIDPWLTEEVWRRLQKQNPKFFVEYDLRLKLVEQINMFNSLAEHQCKLMGYVSGTEVPLISCQNGGHSSSGPNLVESIVAGARSDQSHINSIRCNPSNYQANEGFSALSNFCYSQSESKNKKGAACIPGVNAIMTPNSDMTMKSGTNTSGLNGLPPELTKKSEMKSGASNNKMSSSDKATWKQQVQIEDQNSKLEELPRKFSFSDLSGFIDDLDYSVNPEWK